MELSQGEADVLKEYLLWGGFLVVDDFHGTEEWVSFEEQIRMKETGMSPISVAFSTTVAA